MLKTIWVLTVPSQDLSCHKTKHVPFPSTIRSLGSPFCRPGALQTWTKHQNPCSWNQTLTEQGFQAPTWHPASAALKQNLAWHQ